MVGELREEAPPFALPPPPPPDPPVRSYREDVIGEAFCFFPDERKDTHALLNQSHCVCVCVCINLPCKLPVCVYTYIHVMYVHVEEPPPPYMLGQDSGES